MELLMIYKISPRPSLLKRGIPPFCKEREGGIVGGFRQYKFIGSFEFNVAEL